MQPFRRFLSLKHKFELDDELDKAFKESQGEIIKAIREGVKIFEKRRTTVLNMDWSESVLQYFLFQKHCECPSWTTECCRSGWKIILAGSRFLQKSKLNYWPVEGEALAVKWALED